MEVDYKQKNEKKVETGSCEVIPNSVNTEEDDSSLTLNPLELDKNKLDVK